MWLLRSLTMAFVLTATAALAQTPSIAPNPQIEIAYEPPANPAFVHIYQRLTARKVLETLAQFLAPLKLDRKLTVKIDQCGAKARRYDRAQRLATLCYEYIDEVERLAPKSTVVLVQGPVTTDSAIVGPVVQSLLHEVAMAAFNILAVPVWGRLDDAADRVAAFVMVQFGANVAWNTIVGTAWFLSGTATNAPDYSDVRGTVAQRYYTTLCLAYGREQVEGNTVRQGNVFQPFVSESDNSQTGNLPISRARGCSYEYLLMKQAFNDTIMPHLDQALLKQVAGALWINFSTR